MKNGFSNAERDFNTVSIAKDGRIVRFSVRQFFRALTPIAAIILMLATPQEVDAFNVCSDDESCAHENMTRAGLDLYLLTADPPAELAEELERYWSVEIIPSIGPPYEGASIKGGTGNPDQFDPLYNNEGIHLTNAHLWDADGFLENPFVDPTNIDDYPNALNAAKGLWSRALGEYAVGNKAGAYQLLGMVSHYLGDQCIPAHAHNDPHPAGIPIGSDDETFEVWMSGGFFPHTLLTRPNDRYNDDGTGVYDKGMLDIPDKWRRDHLDILWLLLNVNQYADVFASDEVNGDYSPAQDRKYINPPLVNYPSLHDIGDQGVHDAIADEIELKINKPDYADNPRFPTLFMHLLDNEYNTVHGETGGNDDDGDLSIIRNHSYFYGVRGMAALFKLWEEAISNPILVVTVHTVGATTEIDNFSEADLYVGMSISEIPFPDPTFTGSLPRWDPHDVPGDYLFTREGDRREVDGWRLPANVTIYDAATRFLDDDVIAPNFHFGYAYPADGNYDRNVYIELQVRDDDPDGLADPYYMDDLVDVAKGLSPAVLARANLENCIDPTVHDDYNLVTLGSNSLIHLEPKAAGAITISSGEPTAIWGIVGFSVKTFSDLPPTISLIDGDVEITIECHVGDYMEPGAEVKDDHDIGLDVVIGGVVDTLTPGTYIVTYDATDSDGNNAVQVTRTVRVEDRIAPVLTCPDDIVVNPTSPNGAVVNFTPTATDLCSGTNVTITTSPVMAGDTFPVGSETAVMVTATDGSGNTATCSFMVKVRDQNEVFDTMAIAMPRLGLNPWGSFVLNRLLSNVQREYLLGWPGLASYRLKQFTFIVRLQVMYGGADPYWAQSVINSADNLRGTMGYGDPPPAKRRLRVRRR